MQPWTVIGTQSGLEQAVRMPSVPPTTPLTRAIGADRVRPRLSIRTLFFIASGLAQSIIDPPDSWVTEDGRRYARVRDRLLYDAWLIEWSPTSTLGLHDHGGSQGVLTVLRGQLVETRRDARRRERDETQTLRAGDATPVQMACVHAVSNPGPEVAVSLHLYSPPLRTTNFVTGEERSPNRITLPSVTAR